MTTDSDHEFSACRTFAEIISVANVLLGPDNAAILIRDGGLPKHMLLEAAAELRDVGLKELSALCRKTARSAPLGTLDFIERQRLRKLGLYPTLGDEYRAWVANGRGPWPD